MTCSEILEALELSRCLFLMKYVLDLSFDVISILLKLKILQLCSLKLLRYEIDSGYF